MILSKCKQRSMNLEHRDKGSDNFNPRTRRINLGFLHSSLTMLLLSVMMTD